MAMTLTPSQQSAFQQFEEFINSDDRIFILKGSAGTGKTTLLKAFVEYLDNKGWRSVLMAPTGRASFILGKKTEHFAATIHRTIYTIEKGLEDDGKGKMFFGIRINDDSIDRTIYFVDEASMVSDNNGENDMFKFGSGFLLKDLLEYCGGRKIVFVGDYAQLPPIGQSVSPALSPEYLQETYNAVCQEAMLKEIVRQDDGSSILKNATAIRDSIESKTYNEFGICDGEDVIKSESLIDDYKKIVNGAADDESIVIAFSNKQVLDYNMSIRDYLFPDNTDRIVPGERLMVTQNNYSYFEELFNGTMVRVLSCNSDSATEKRTVRFNTAEKDAFGNSIVEEIELSFRRAKIETPAHNQIECLILDNYLTDINGSNTNKCYQALITDFNNRMSKQGVNKKTDIYKSNLKTDPYLHALVCKYGYAVTCHKAQGGEWKNVFVDMDKLGGKQNSDYFRWAYTAITRSNCCLWHFASPMFNAVSSMVVMPISKTEKMSYYVPEGERFLDWHYQKISSLCGLRDISCSENRDVAFQHLLSFEKEGKSCTIQQWYNKNGYTPKRVVLRTTDKGFASEMLDLIGEALVPETIPFVPKTEFATKLHELVLAAAEESDIRVLNVSQTPWKDIYYLKTTPFESVLSFCYNAKGIYSSATPQSTGGNDDAVLKAFCSKIQ